MIVALCIAILLVVSTILINYETLRFAGKHFSLWPRSPHLRVLLTVLTTFLSHGISIALYAVAYMFFLQVLNLGNLGGSGSLHLEDYLYFSAVTYSSLGYGDIVPQGHLRLIAGVEGLNGLMLIAWSATYTYLNLERHWLARFYKVQVHSKDEV